MPSAPRPFAAAAVAGVAAAALMLAGCGSDSPPAAGSSSPAAGSAATGPTIECTYSPDGRDPAKQVDPPASQQPDSGTVTADLALDAGTITLELDRAATPCTVGSFVHLAQSGYYDDTPCHRLTASPSLSVLQCGDPSGTGRGGPGYAYADETSADMTYPAGTVAMANAGPDTNGSQFFLVYADSTLPPDYTVFGTITGGMDVLTGIAGKGIDAGGTAPAVPVKIESVTVSG